MIVVLTGILIAISVYSLIKVFRFFTTGAQNRYYYETKTDSDGNVYESVIDYNETSTEHKEK